MKHLSTGDLFRAAIKNKTPLGQEAQRYLDQGKLVPDSIVIGMVEEVLGKIGSQSFILDGFPRTVPQAQALGFLLQDLKLKIDQAIFLEVPAALLLGRLTGRRVCKNCGATYHVEGKPTQRPGVCDLCGGPVVQREDDKAEVIQTRLDAYEQSTKPLKAFYQDSGQLVAVDGTGTANEVFARVEKELSRPT